jgi:hypothetical protein
MPVRVDLEREDFTGVTRYIGHADLGGESRAIDEGEFRESRHIVNVVVGVVEV